MDVSPAAFVHIWVVFEGVPPHDGLGAQGEVKFSNFTIIGVPVGYCCGTVDPVEEKVGRDGVLVLLAEEQSHRC